MAYGLGRTSSMQSSGATTPIESHTGDYRSMLRRFSKKAAKAVAAGPGGIGKLGPELLKLIADARNLRVAWDFLRRNGGTAPGPNGRTYDDFTNHEVWELLRALGQAIRSGTYRPGPDRKVKIPKSSGRGHRTLRLHNIEDRVVARAIVQIIQPLLDPGFDRHSYGYRPGLDRRHALATAIHLATTENRMTWVLEDARDAFDNVPLNRLLDIVRRRLPAAEDVWTLIERALQNSTRRGLRQGSPLAPLMLNLYLDHFLDRAWRRLLPDTPLLRSADDLLVLCRTKEGALKARDLLRRWGRRMALA